MTLRHHCGGCARQHDRRDRANDKKLKVVFDQHDAFQRWITSIHNTGMGEKITAARLANNRWKVEAVAVAA